MKKDFNAIRSDPVADEKSLGGREPDFEAIEDEHGLHNDDRRIQR